MEIGSAPLGWCVSDARKGSWPAGSGTQSELRAAALLPADAEARRRVVPQQPPCLQEVPRKPPLDHHLVAK